MSHLIALKQLEQPIVDNRPFLFFNEMNQDIFKRIVPSAELANGVKTVYRGQAFRLPTVLPPGKTLCTIEPHCLPGYIDRHIWSGYVWLDATDDQFEQIKKLVQMSRYYGDNTYYCADGHWWTFPLGNLPNNQPQQLQDWHELYWISPPTGWHHDAVTVVGDETYLIAVHGNYGTESKRTNNGHVSALKISAEAFRTIDFLFHADIIDHTTPRSTYRYITFHNPDLLQRKDAHFFYFNISGRDLKALETLAKKMMSRCYVWIHDAWYAMPTTIGMYAKTLGGELPYRPANPQSAPAYQPPRPRAAGESASAALKLRGRQITATYSEQTPGEPGWWWIRGDNENATKSIRFELRKFNCDWSKRRQSWYYIGRTMPDGLLKLLGIEQNPAANPPAPPVQSPAVVPPPEAPAPEAPAANDLYGPGATIYARHDMLTPSETTVASGTRGVITAKLDPDGLGYEHFVVTFDGHAPYDASLRDVTHYAPLPGIKHTLISIGYSANKHLTTELPRLADPPREYAPTAPSSVEPPPSSLSAPADSAAALPSSADADLPTPVPLLPAAEETPALPSMTIRSASDLLGTGDAASTLRSALNSAHTAAPLINAAPARNGKLLTFSQEYVGELTGSVSGDVHCYGYGLDKARSLCVYVNMGGPRMAVEAIRAKLGLGQIVNLTPWDAPAIELSAGEGSKGMYQDEFANMSERKFCNLILLHKSITEPVYDGKFVTYILSIHELQASQKVYEHVKALLKIPVFPSWRDYLWHAGCTAALIRKITTGGGLTAYALDLDTDFWTRLIAVAVEKHHLSIPNDKEAS